MKQMQHYDIVGKRLYLISSFNAGGSNRVFSLLVNQDNLNNEI